MATAANGLARSPANGGPYMVRELHGTNTPFPNGRDAGAPVVLFSRPATTYGIVVCHGTVCSKLLPVQRRLRGPLPPAAAPTAAHNSPPPRQTNAPTGPPPMRRCPVCRAGHLNIRHRQGPTPPPPHPVHQRVRRLLVNTSSPARTFATTPAGTPDQSTNSQPLSRRGHHPPGRTTPAGAATAPPPANSAAQSHRQSANYAPQCGQSALPPTAQPNRYYPPPAPPKSPAGSKSANRSACWRRRLPVTWSAASATTSGPGAPPPR